MKKMRQRESERVREEEEEYELPELYKRYNISICRIFDNSLWPPYPFPVPIKILHTQIYIDEYRWIH